LINCSRRSGHKHTADLAGLIFSARKWEIGRWGETGKWCGKWDMVRGYRTQRDLRDLCYSPVPKLINAAKHFAPFYFGLSLIRFNNLIGLIALIELH